MPETTLLATDISKFLTGQLAIQKHPPFFTFHLLPHIHHSALLVVSNKPNFLYLWFLGCLFVFVFLMQNSSEGMWACVMMRLGVICNYGVIEHYIKK